MTGLLGFSFPIFQHNDVEVFAPRCSPDEYLGFQWFSLYIAVTSFHLPTLPAGGPIRPSPTREREGGGPPWTPGSRGRVGHGRLGRGRLGRVGPRARGGDD